jgi:ankyrin repeat protein
MLNVHFCKNSNEEAFEAGEMLEKEHYQVVKLLDGSASKLRSGESISTFLRHHESVLEQMNDSTRLSPFQNAVNMGNSCLVKKFLKQGSDIDETDCAGYTAVLRAVVKNTKRLWNCS